MREQIAQHQVIQRASRQPTNTSLPPDDDDDLTTVTLCYQYAPERHTLPVRPAIYLPAGQPPHCRASRSRRRRRFHWRSFWGLGMILRLGVLIGGSHVMAWWSDHQLNSTYGMPRTYQVDEVVGNGDSAAHPTHFIFLNLNGRVEIIEIPPDASRARIYSGPTLYTDNASQTPVTAEFEDVDGDGKIDMIVHIGDQRLCISTTGRSSNRSSRSGACLTWTTNRWKPCIFTLSGKKQSPRCFPFSCQCCSLPTRRCLRALPYQQPVTRAVIRVPAVLLPLKTFTAQIAVIPTGIQDLSGHDRAWHLDHYQRLSYLTNLASGPYIYY